MSERESYRISATRTIQPMPGKHVSYELSHVLTTEKIEAEYVLDFIDAAKADGCVVTVAVVTEKTI